MPEDAQPAENPVEAQIETGKNMSVKVYSPFKVYFEGLAISASAESKTGPFDILPKHHNFITLLEPCDLTIRVEGQDDEVIPIGGGIMHVKADQVTVFLDV
jgi:F0F1-type ATP synthase epsilon subunit